MFTVHSSIPVDFVTYVYYYTITNYLSFVNDMKYDGLMESIIIFFILFCVLDCNCNYTVKIITIGR